jgi:hypothetical protein
MRLCEIAPFFSFLFFSFLLFFITLDLAKTGGRTDLGQIKQTKPQ